MVSVSVCLLVSLLQYFLIFSRASSSSDDSYCCCCDLSGASYGEVSRKWTKSDGCGSGSKCCNMGSKYECELELNPTFDGSCGHNGEASYQSKNGGSSSVAIPRNGYSSDYDLKGWLGQRLVDEEGNEIQEWCIDNGDNDSFFLFRYVKCNGDYPNWFGRCVFPSANNALYYAPCESCDNTAQGCDYSEFSSTIPSCFGEIEHMNIGEGSDYGREVLYRLLPEQKHEWIWCGKNGEPTNPPDGSSKVMMYDGAALSQGDGMTPFYLEQCREVVHVSDSSSPSSETLIDLPEPYRNDSSSASSASSGCSDSVARGVTEMRPLSFAVSVVLATEKSENYDRKYSFEVVRNDIRHEYESGPVVKQGDSWSLSMKAVVAENVRKVDVPQNWNYTMKAIDDNANTFITFVYESEQVTDLRKIGKIGLFDVVVRFNEVKAVSWIARSVQRRSKFVGFGKIDI